MRCSTSWTEPGGTPMGCAMNCAATSARRWAMRQPCWSSMKLAFSKKAASRWGCSGKYSGTAGRIENCQVGVFVSYASAKGACLLDRELYLPKSWTQDPERCQETKVPAEVKFATKPELAARMLWRTLDAGMPAAWVTGDTVYGSNAELRAGLETHSQAYALGVRSHEWVEVGGQRVRVDRLAKGLSASAVAVAECRSGSQRATGLRLDGCSVEQSGPSRMAALAGGAPKPERSTQGEAGLFPGLCSSRNDVGGDGGGDRESLYHRAVF